MINGKYQYEMHLHTKEFGWCAHVMAKDIVDAYVKAGYDGICVTNHFFSEGMDSMAGTTWNDKVDSWLVGYEAARKQAAKYQDFDVILGAELRIEQGYEDFLLYGVTREILIQNPDIFQYSQKECFDFANENNMLLFQAHPFRAWLNLKDLKYLHGLEVFNGNPRHDSHDLNALKIARNNTNLLLITGSDYHETGDEATAALLFESRIKDSSQLVDSLKKGEGELWIKPSQKSREFLNEFNRV